MLNVEFDVGVHSASGATAIQRWFVEAAPMIEALMAAADASLEAAHQRCDSISATSSQLTVSAKEGREWLLMHPCPNRMLGEHFGNLFTVFGALGKSFDLAARGESRTSTSELDREADQAAELVVNTMALFGDDKASAGTNHDWE